MRVSVRGDKVFVRPDTQPNLSDGGLHLVYDRQQSTMRGVVVALGRGPVTTTGVFLPHIVSVGDSVIFSPDSGTELLFEKETVVCLREDDILAVIEG